MKNNQKGFAAIAAVIIILALLAGGYYLSTRPQIKNTEATPMGTATSTLASSAPGWKTYRNDKYEFKYPDDWQVYSGSSDTYVQVGIPPGPDIFTVNFVNYPNPGGSTAKALAQKAAQTENYRFRKEFDVKLGALDAYELEGVYQIDQSDENIYLVSGTEAVLITFPISDPNTQAVEVNNDLAHQLLSTFRFTK